MNKRLLGLLLCFCVAASGNAKAQNAAETELDPIVISTSRIAHHDYKLTGNITVIQGEDITASTAQNIPELLNETLAIHVTDTGTSKTSTLDIRGFGDTAARNILVLVNDRILNTVDISPPDLMQIPLSSVERIEIIRGAGSVLYGDRAVGGVINIITKKGKGNLSGKFGSSIGSYDKRETDIELSGSKGDFAYFLYSLYKDDRGYRQNSDVLSKSFNTRLDYELSNKFAADIDLSHHEDSYGLPGYLTGPNLSALGPRASTFPNDFARSKDDNLKLGFNITPWPENLYLGSLGVNLYYRDRNIFDSFDFGMSLPYKTNRSTRTKGLGTKYIFDHEVFNKELHFVTGVDLYDTENDIIGSGSNPDDVTISRTDVGLFGQAEYEALDNIFVNAGLRYARADYAFSQRNSAVDEKRDPDALVYNGGLKYEYAKGSNVYFSIQRTFRFLATDEWYSSSTFFGATPGLNLNLDQQKGIQYEAGLKHNLNNITTLSLTPYWIENRNEIYFDPSASVNSNYKKTTRYGVEVGQETDIAKLMNIALLDKLSLSTSYTFQRPFFSGGANDGKIIPLVPRQQFTTTLAAQFWDHYNVSLITTYVGAQFAVNDVTNIVPKVEPYITLDEKISYQRENWEIFGSINNIFNQRYSPYVFSYGTAQYFYPAPGRNFIFGTKIKF
ncbi:MAG: TonB-dependent receptor [Candidatus Omnitrophota bacterium]